MAALSPKLNLLSRFCTLLFFKDGNLLSPLAPLHGEIDICVCGLFRTKFNAKQLLFQSFFDVVHLFGSVEPQTESTFPFLHIIIFQRWLSFEPLAPLWGEIDYASRFFCTKFNAEQFLFQTFFDAVHIFGCVEPLSEFTLLFLYIVFFFQIGESVKQPSSTPGGDRHMCPLLCAI